jgi:hypothetical protein
MAKIINGGTQTLSAMTTDDQVNLRLVVVNSTDQGASSEADNCSADEMTSCLFWNLMLHFRVYKIPPLGQS